MEKLEIYKDQAESIENALRLASRTLDGENKQSQSCMDRDIIQALGMVRNILNKDIETLVKRF